MPSFQSFSTACRVRRKTEREGMGSIRGKTRLKIPKSVFDASVFDATLIERYLSREREEREVRERDCRERERERREREKREERERAKRKRVDGSGELGRLRFHVGAPD